MQLIMTFCGIANENNNNPQYRIKVTFVLRTQERKGMPWFPHPIVQHHNFKWIPNKQNNNSLLWNYACQCCNCKFVNCCAITPLAHGISSQNKHNLLFAIYYTLHKSNAADTITMT
jgi:hypothetical protein